MKEKLYKISEVSEILGVHPDTVRNWEEEGLINPKRIGKRGDRRYSVQDIQEIKDKNLISTLAKKNPKKKDYSILSKEELIKEIQILNKQKSFGLVYEEKKEQIVEDCKNKAPILKPKTKFRIEDKNSNSDKPKHILIQGDNYHALKVLNYTHKNKIDVIYIDPPYNTGNKDFIYNDDYVDREDSYRHSKWISFMEKRLVLARELLKDSGVIFISIDDNEQARLKLLCDEIFGEVNFITNFPRLTVKGGKTQSIYSTSNLDYVLVYVKNKSFSYFNKINVEGDPAFKYKDKYFESRGFYHTKQSLDSNNLGYIASLDYPIEYKGHIYYPGGTKEKNGYRWTWSKKRFEFALKNDFVEFKNGRIWPKKYMLASIEKKGDSYCIEYLSRMKNYSQLTFIENEFSNTNGTKDIKDLDIEEFNNTKPVSLINTVIRMSERDKNSIILDFFAGSGTTGHAVLELNKEDGGNRQVILCTNNENGIAEKVTFERMKRIMKGYENAKKEKVEGLGGELEYFETELVDVENMNRVDDDRKLAFTLEAGWVIATKENTFNELEKNDSYQIFEGVENVKGKSITKTVAIYFKENLDKLKELENKVLKNENVKLYIFSHYTNEFVSEYASYPNVKVCDIPEPILKVYRGFNNS